jgi:DNA-binding transcriptional MerR regulator
MDERLSGVRFLLRDRDAKCSGPFDEVVRTEGVRAIRTPIRAPRANAFAERFVRTVRRECLDHILIYDRRHLERVLQTYVAHYLEERPHRGLSLGVPADIRTPPVRDAPRTPVERRDVLGGLVHEYRSGGVIRIFEPFTRLGEDATGRLSFIRAGQSIGLSLGEIREVLAFRDRGEVPCAHVASLIERRVAELSERIGALERMRRDLERLAKRARRTSRTDDQSATYCHIIEAR